jgi:hypothetical protein
MPEKPRAGWICKENHRRHLLHARFRGKELAGDYFNIVTVIPNGLDIHEWEPSAKDIEAITTAILIARNGLGLEGGREKLYARHRMRESCFLQHPTTSLSSK